MNFIYIFVPKILGKIVIAGILWLELKPVCAKRSVTNIFPLALEFSFLLESAMISAERRKCSKILFCTLRGSGLNPGRESGPSAFIHGMTFSGKTLPTFPRNADSEIRPVKVALKVEKNRDGRLGKTEIYLD
jgi:hypothetical protein